MNAYLQLALAAATFLSLVLHFFGAKRPTVEKVAEMIDEGIALAPKPKA